MKRLEKARKKAETICDNVDVTDKEKAQQLKKYVLFSIYKNILECSWHNKKSFKNKVIEKKFMGVRSRKLFSCI